MTAQNIKVCTHCGKSFVGRGVIYCSLACSRAGHVGEKHYAWAGGKDTIKDRKRIYLVNNKDKIAERKRKDYLKNKDIIKARSKEHYYNNVDKIKEYTRLKNESNPEKNRKRVKEWRAANKDKARALRSKWKKNNKDKVNIDTNNRRARIRMAEGRLSKDIVIKLLVIQKYKCYICRASLKRHGHHLDHIIPISKGGKNEDSNVQLACPTCNTTKRDTDPIKFMQQMGYLL